MMCDGSNVYCSFKAVMNTNTILRSSKGPPMKWEHQLFLLATKPQREGLHNYYMTMVILQLWHIIDHAINTI